MRLLTTLLALLLTAGILAGQRREKGPWWPHPIWGAGDQSGASNWITPEKVLQALKLAENGKVYELGQVYQAGMPLYGQRTYSMHIPVGASVPWGRNRLVGNEEFLCAEIGQVGTQFDGLGHIGQRLKMADGSEQDVFYNGFTGGEVRAPYGLQKLGVENVKPIITRGVLIDVAGFKGVETLPAGYEVTVEDVRGALANQGIEENSLAPGDALLFRYGWSKLWSDPARYNDNPPGIGLPVARWVVEKKAAMVGSDQWGTEVAQPASTGLAFPVHQELIMKNGIFNLESMVLDELAAEGAYEFLFIFTPVRFKGATGSPGRPLAIR